jgi:hypothetical protein
VAAIRSLLLKFVLFDIINLCCRYDVAILLALHPLNAAAHNGLLHCSKLIFSRKRVAI